MTSDALDVQDLADIATTVSPGDEVELENSSTRYKNPLEVIDAQAVTFENPLAGDWTAARVRLQGARGGEHDIRGVDELRPVRDHHGLKIYDLTPTQVVATNGAGHDPNDVDEQESVDEVDGSPPEGMTPGEIVAVAEYYETLEEVAEDLEVTTERARAILVEHDVIEEVDLGE